MRFPRHGGVVGIDGVVGLVAVDMFIGRADIELDQCIADLHINVKFGAQVCAWRRSRVVSEPACPGQTSLVIQEEQKATQGSDLVIDGNMEE